jgi:hypothetical protein
VTSENARLQTLIQKGIHAGHAPAEEAEKELRRYAEILDAKAGASGVSRQELERIIDEECDEVRYGSKQ